MRRLLKFFGFLVFAGLLFVAVVSLAFYHLVRVGEFRRFMIAEIEQQTALKVRVGEARLEMGRILGIAFQDVAVSDDAGAQPALTAARVTARVALLPLLQRKVIFDEIRLQNPTAHLTRSPDGGMPLLDKLLNLPFLRGRDAEFSLNLRAIKITDGQIELIFPGAEGRTADLHLADVDLDVTRVRGDALRKLIAGLVKARPTPASGPALEFRLNARVEREGENSSVKAQGRMLLDSDEVEFGKAWWDADLQLVDVPPSVLHEFGASFGVASVTGHLAQRLHVVGNLAQQLQLRGDVEFRGLTAELPDLFGNPLVLGDGRAEVAIEWTPQRLELSRIFFRSKQVQFGLHGVIRDPGGRDPQFRLNLSEMSMPLQLLPDMLPLKLLGSPELEGWIALFDRGELRLTSAGVNAALSQIRGMVNSAGLLWFEGQVRDAAATLPVDGALPIAGLGAQIRYKRGMLIVHNLKARYGNSQITDLDGTFGIMSGAPTFEFRVRADVDLAEAQQQLKLRGLPPQVDKIASLAEQIGGKGKLDLVAARAGTAPLRLEGGITLENARMRVGELALSDVRGDLSVSSEEIRTQNMRATLLNAPLQIQATVTDYQKDNGTFDLAVESTGVKAGVVARLLISSGSLQDPGMVRGAVRYRGLLNKAEGRRFTGNLDLINVQLALKPLLQPIRELSGRITIDEQGIDFQNIRAVVAGIPANFTGRWRYTQQPRLLFDFSSPSLDVNQLLAQVDPEATDFYANLQAVGKIAVAAGRVKRFDFTDFRSDLMIDRRVWRFTNPTMRSAGGFVQGVATFTDKPDWLGFSLAPNIQGVSVQSFLKWFDMSTTEMTGKVNFSGKVESSGTDGAEKKRNLQGSFSLKIEDGTLHRLRILVQILNLLDLSRWFTLKMPDLAKQGIRFRKITGDFKIVDGVYSTRNLVVDSDDLRMTGEGKIDVPKDQVDFLVAVRPFAGIDTAISYIPLIGRGIAAIKNSFLVASFTIKGPIDDPTITPAPLSTLSEVVLGVLGIPKNIIGTLVEPKKEEPAKDELKASTREKSAASNP